MTKECNKSLSPYAYTSQLQWRIVFWSCWHIFVLAIFTLGLIFTDLYMMESDDVLIISRNRGAYNGTTGCVLRRITARDAALRGCNLFLNRSYEFTDFETEYSVYSKMASRNILSLIQNDASFFRDHKIVQKAKIDTVKVFPSGENKNAAVVKIEGVLKRNGIYFGLPYQQDLAFRFNALVIPNSDRYGFPLILEKFYYNENTIHKDREFQKNNENKFVNTKTGETAE